MTVQGWKAELRITAPVTVTFNKDDSGLSTSGLRSDKVTRAVPPGPCVNMQHTRHTDSELSFSCDYNSNTRDLHGIGGQTVTFDWRKLGTGTGLPTSTGSGVLATSLAFAEGGVGTWSCTIHVSKDVTHGTQ